MLVRYKKALEKIAMGLLSFMPQEKDIKRLMETVQQYEQQDNWMLYLWKRGDEYVGIVGVLVEETVATIQHITVIPSHRGEGIALKMVQELCDLGLFTEIKPNEETEPFVQKCIPIIKEAECN